MDLKTQLYYSKEARSFFNSTVGVDMSNIYAKFLPFLKPNSKILDAGCGSGRDSKYFKQLGFHIEAFDASPELCQLASEFLNINVTCTKFEDLEYYNEFHAIWACASLLHLDDKALGIALDKFIAALRPLGVIYCSFKHGQGESIHNSRFFNFQNIDSFSSLIHSKKEISILEDWVTADNRPGREKEEWFNVVLRKG